MIDVLKIAGGLLLLYLGGEGLVRGSVSLAKALRLSPFYIGVVVVGFGTSMPELAASLDAGFKNSPDLAVGNVVGSNMANVLLILGVAGLIHPVKAVNKTVFQDSLIGALSAMLLFYLIMDGKLTKLEAGFLLLALLSYIVLRYIVDKKRNQSLDPSYASSKEEWGRLMSFIISAMGIVGLVSGADLLVTGAKNLAIKYGVSEAVIGLTLVAVGTSLPELATGIVASIKKESDIVLGNVLGSNIFNMLCILGVVGVLQPLSINQRFIRWDVPWMTVVLVITALILLPARKIPRWLAIILLCTYVVYIFLLYQPPWLLQR